MTANDNLIKMVFFMVKLCDSELKALMIIKHTNITAGESKKENHNNTDSWKIL